MLRQLSTSALTVLILALPGCGNQVEPSKPDAATQEIVTGGTTTAEEPKAAAGEKQITNSIGMKLTLVPSGEFMMGGEESAEAMAEFVKKTDGMTSVKANDFEGEHPQHRVRITKPFYMGIYHVTRGQFRQFVADTHYKTDAEKGEKPGAYGWNAKRTDFGFDKNSPGGTWVSSRPTSTQW